MVKAVTHTKVNSNRKLVIFLEMTENQEAIAAAMYINKVDNIAKKYRLNDDQIRAYDDFISSIYSIIISKGFEIIEKYQSHTSYSYYIVFYPKTRDGVNLDAFEIEFRISDHDNRGLSVDVPTVTKGRIFKSFVIGSERYKTTADVMIAVGNICEGLKDGDYGVLESE